MIELNTIVGTRDVIETRHWNVDLNLVPFSILLFSRVAGISHLLQRSSHERVSGHAYGCIRSLSRTLLIVGWSYRRLETESANEVGVNPQFGSPCDRTQRAAGSIFNFNLTCEKCTFKHFLFLNKLTEDWTDVCFDNLLVLYQSVSRTVGSDIDPKFLEWNHLNSNQAAHASMKTMIFCRFRSQVPRLKFLVTWLKLQVHVCIMFWMMV